MVHQSHQHLIVHVTNHCNFRCAHCFIDFSPKRDLKLERYQRLASEVGALHWLDIGGGEPFLRKDLAKIVGSFDTRIASIPTNGSLFDAMVAQIDEMRQLSEAEIVISLSLDGLEETHDSVRGHEGNWNQVWTAFDYLRGRGDVSVKINTVLSNRNVDEIIDLMKEVRRVRRQNKWDC